MTEHNRRRPEGAHARRGMDTEAQAGGEPQERGQECPTASSLFPRTQMTTTRHSVLRRGQGGEKQGLVS